MSGLHLVDTLLPLDPLLAPDALPLPEGIWHFDIYLD
jgi:hypothetical protein